MQGYIIVCPTNIHNSTEFINLSNALAAFSTILDWSIDLTDSDKVLRLVTSRDITLALIVELEQLGIECNSMGTFTNNLRKY